MSIANVILGLAQSIAEMRNQIFYIDIKEHSIDFGFRPKSSNENRIHENHYDNIAVYIDGSANPVKISLQETNSIWEEGKESVFNIVDNLITTKHYRTFMKQEAIERAYSVKGTNTEKLVQFMYVIIGLLAVNLIMLVAIYGG